MQIGQARVDLDRFQVWHGARTVRLSAQEVALLRVFERSGREAEDGRMQATVPREDLYREGLGYRSAEGSRALDYAIRRLRSKLEDGSSGPAALETVRGEGYRLSWTAVRRQRRPGPLLIGRDAELAQLKQALDGGELCTLIGPPGVGKSALARAWAQEVGAAWVDVPGTSSASSALVLDHCETALEAAREQALAASRRGARVVCTTRRRLGLPDERVIDVGPLERADAVELLRVHTARAGAVQPPPPALEALAEACDDLPLAIVLVAPRLRSLPADRLVQRLQGDSDADGLDAALETAWTGLSPPARALLARLCTAGPSFSLDELEALAPAGQDGLAIIEELVEHSVLRARLHSGAGLRYRLLRPLQRAVRRRLAAAGEPG